MKNRKKSISPKQAELKRISAMNPAEVLAELKSRPTGLANSVIEELQDQFGLNTVTSQRAKPWYLILLFSFNDPFVYVLFLLAIVSVVTGDLDGATVMFLMIALSVGIRFRQEYRSQQASSDLTKLIQNTSAVMRDGVVKEIPMDQIVPGDVIELRTGDMIPADAYLFETRDLFINQSSLTGESMPVEKNAEGLSENQDSEMTAFDQPNLVFMGTDVLSGSGKAVILKTGRNTFFNGIAQSVTTKKAVGNFEKGMRSVSRFLILMMLALVPVVFLINGFTKNDWGQAFFFAIAIAVGLTPEMLPTVVNSNLAKGALTMAKEEVIVKRLNAIQSLGAIDTLFTDKTGTLTEDRVVVMRHVNVFGEDNDDVLQLAYMNSNYQTGWSNLMDAAIIEYVREHPEQEKTLPQGLNKYDEIPFDFSRRRSTVAVRNKEHQWMITKGAFEEMLSISKYVMIGEKREILTSDMKEQLARTNRELNEQGMRVLMIAYRMDLHRNNDYTVEDEKDMTIAGFLGFLDPPKKDAEKAIKLLREHGVKVKILTGDNAIITQHVADDVGIDNLDVVWGHEIDQLDDQALLDTVQSHDLFVKLSPEQKARVIKVMRSYGNTVGFMGDGINDAPALRQADVGISVKNAADITKDVSDIVLLEKSLLVLETGIIEGRKVYANTMKYIKMTISSNFGNALSVLIASIFLPFLPMLSVQLLVQNLIYDTSQMSIPWDNVDKETLMEPTPWRLKGLFRFTVIFGPLSSIFDILTFVTLWFAFGIGAHAGNPAWQHDFQAGWFVVGLLTQTLVVYIFRTQKVPSFSRHASNTVILATLLAVAAGLIVITTPLRVAFEFGRLPGNYAFAAILLTAGYLLTVELVKVFYLKRYHEWL
ncbi:magnesium-translocating P-type ATPase [Xylocopilactobacillus apicola]|uniref:Magnesium-transporting ATPase, P-type 1 n=2 Tax=Xylocopilactobacillus apicola TaxID=2932184 RepID=A0AAU9DZ38_9LACO|nr:magnesium-translocating P-type ATPase [Xylocopilactobacillus apicola]